MKKSVLHAIILSALAKEKIMVETQKTDKKYFKKILGYWLVFFPIYFIYLLTLYPTVGTEDSGELIVSAATLDIAHPPGYPLHTLLGKLFTILIPFGNIGWRVNLLSAFFGAATVTLLYLFIKKLTKHDLLAMTASLFFGLSDIFWSQSIRTETYTLNSFFLILILVILLTWYETKANKYLLWLAFLYGLSLTNHHLMFLAGPPILIFVLIADWKKVLQIKTVALCLLLFIAGLSVYLYLPIRTLLGPYDNPAYIEHNGLHTPQQFFDFVNRKIYGGTLSEGSSTSQEQTSMLPGWLETGKNTIINLGGKFIKSNADGLILFLQRVSEEVLFLPILFFLPGIYFLIAREKKLALLLLGFFFFYSSFQLVFTGLSKNMHPFSVFSFRPFLINATLIAVVISSVGFHFLYQKIPSAKIKKPLLVLLLFIPLIPLIRNFSKNNESHNYLAYDFNRMLIESLPPNAYVLSTGRDNLTFPLYYLRKIDNIRPDVDLEIYYGKNAVEKNYLEQKKEEKDKDMVFIDLLPHKYADFNFVPYNFVYAYGADSSLTHRSKFDFSLRGIRSELDYPNRKLLALYYLKVALSDPNDPAQRDLYFKKLQTELPDMEQFNNFITEYYQGKDDTGMF